MIDERLSSNARFIRCGSGQRFCRRFYERAKNLGVDESPFPDKQLWDKYVQLFDQSVPGRNILPGYGPYNLLLMTSQAEADRRHRKAFKLYLVRARAYQLAVINDDPRWVPERSRWVTSVRELKRLRNAAKAVLFLRMFVDFDEAETRILKEAPSVYRFLLVLYPLPPETGPRLFPKLPRA